MVQTVLGEVPASSLGVVLIHEHLLADSTQDLGRQPLPPEIPDLWDDELDAANFAIVDRHIINNRSNLVVTNVDVAVAELEWFRSAGGGCLVDVTPVGMGPRIDGLVEASQRAGVHVVAGAGVYIGRSHPPWVAESSPEQIEDWLMGACTAGTGAQGARPGMLGEIGVSWPIQPQELKVLSAAIRVSTATDLPLTIHPGRHHQGPATVLELALKAGADPRRLVLGHLDMRLTSDAQFRAIADAGCWIACDQFGMESAFSPYVPDRLMSNDGRRLEILRTLIDAGHLDRLLISHDIAVKTRLRTYGGTGFAHILTNVVPMMRRQGFADHEISALLESNPQRCLATRSAPQSPTQIRSDIVPT